MTALTGLTHPLQKLLFVEQLFTFPKASTCSLTKACEKLSIVLIQVKGNNIIHGKRVSESFWNF